MNMYVCMCAVLAPLLWPIGSAPTHACRPAHSIELPVLCAHRREFQSGVSTCNDIHVVYRIKTPRAGGVYMCDMMYKYDTCTELGFPGTGV